MHNRWAWLQLPDLHIIQVTRIWDFFVMWISWFFKRLALNSECFNQPHCVGQGKGPKARGSCQFLKSIVASPRAPLILNKFNHQTGSFHPTGGERVIKTMGALNKITKEKTECHKIRNSYIWNKNSELFHFRTSRIQISRHESYSRHILWYNELKSGILGLINHYVILAIITSTATCTK